MSRLLLIFVATSFLLKCGAAGDATERSDADWLFDRYIDITDHLVIDSNIGESERKNYKILLYQFAFDYWLISRTNQIAAPFHWRGRIRALLHRVNNPERFADPAGIASSFITHGETNLEPLLTDLPGMHRITVTQYHDLVELFDLAFADFLAVFPPNPPPTNIAVFASPELEQRAGPFAKIEFQGSRWTSVHLEVLGPHRVLDSDGAYKLEHRYDDMPVEVFRALAPKAQAYYLPAFLRFCDRDPNRSQGVPSALLEQLTGISKESEALRIQLNPMQKRAIVAYFEAWCIHDLSPSKIKKLHRVLIDDQ